VAGVSAVDGLSRELGTLYNNRPASVQETPAPVDLEEGGSAALPVGVSGRSGAESGQRGGAATASAGPGQKRVGPSRLAGAGAGEASRRLGPPARHATVDGPTMFTKRDGLRVVPHETI